MNFYKVTLLIHYFTYSIVFLNARLAMFYTLLPFRFMSSSGFLIAGRQPVFDRPSLWPLVDKFLTFRWMGTWCQHLRHGR